MHCSGGSASVAGRASDAELSRPTSTLDGMSEEGFDLLVCISEAELLVTAPEAASWFQAKTLLLAFVP